MSNVILYGFYMVVSLACMLFAFYIYFWAKGDVHEATFWLVLSISADLSSSRAYRRAKEYAEAQP